MQMGYEHFNHQQLTIRKRIKISDNFSDFQAKAVKREATLTNREHVLKRS